MNRPWFVNRPGFLFITFYQVRVSPFATILFPDPGASVENVISPPGGIDASKSESEPGSDPSICTDEAPSPNKPVESDDPPPVPFTVIVVPVAEGRKFNIELDSSTPKAFPSPAKGVTPSVPPVEVY